MTVNTFDWLDVPFYEELKFGQAREELRLAETTFASDMPDDLLLRLYFFVLDRADENAIWEVIMDLVEGLLFLRMVGGPDSVPAKFAKGFDPADHAIALDAVITAALPSKRLVDLLYVAEVNCGQRGHGADPEFGAQWTPIAGLIRTQILARMASGEAQSRNLDSSIQQSKSG